MVNIPDKINDMAEEYKDEPIVMFRFIVPECELTDAILDKVAEVEAMMEVVGGILTESYLCDYG